MSSVLSLGSNLGDRRAHLRLGVEVLEPLRVSPVWETPPVGGVEQGRFLNLVVLCGWDAAEAWRRAQLAEGLAGRVRDVRWGPRTLDVDVVTADVNIADGAVPGLVLPHPRAAQRAFVLLPWLDLDPDAVLAGHGRVDRIPVDRSGLRRLPDAL